MFDWVLNAALEGCRFSAVLFKQIRAELMRDQNGFYSLGNKVIQNFSVLSHTLIYYKNLSMVKEDEV